MSEKFQDELEAEGEAEIESMTDAQVDAELAAKGIDVTAAFGKVREALAKAKRPKHTPGPWCVGPRGGRFCVDAPLKPGGEPGRSDYRIAKTYASPFSPTQEQAAANANLIAAAPDVLAALDELVTLKDEVKLRDPAEYERRKDAAWAAARTAVAKAKGGPR